MLWVALGFGGSLTSAGRDLLIQHHKTDGQAVGWWFRGLGLLVVLPFLAWFDFPTAWQFWALAIASACLLSVTDVIVYNAAATVGAGPTGRLRRISILLTFLLWLAIDPTQADKLIENPLLAALVFAIHALCVFFALRLRHNDFSWQALRLLAGPILSSALAPIMLKLCYDYVDNVTQGAMAYLFIQTLFVLIIWTVRDAMRGKLTFALPRKQGWAALIGAVTLLDLIVKLYAYFYVANPAYVAVVQLTETVWVLAYHKIRGIKDQSDVASGMGIVVCAAVLILLQIFFE